MSDDPAKAKFSWPKTPDGTIDWEAVFEAPDTGLIAQLVNADSHDLVYKVTEIIIRQLFTRKGDETEVETFLTELNGIVDTAKRNGTGVAPTRDSVIDLLRRIKQGRIDKAAAYVAEQKRKGASGKKRVRRRDADRQLALKVRIMLMGGGGLAAALILAGAMYFLVSGDDGGERKEAPPERIAIEDTQDGEAAERPAAPEAAAETQDVPESALDMTPEGYPVGTLGRKEIRQLGSHVMTLSPVLFSRNVGGGKARQTFVLPVLSVRDPESWRDICKWEPSLTETITASLIRELPASEKPESRHFRAAGEVAMQMANKRLGATLIDDIYLLYDMERSLIDAGARCRLLTYD